MPLQLSQDEPKRLRENRLLSVRADRRRMMNAVRLHSVMALLLHEMNRRRCPRDRMEGRYNAAETAHYSEAAQEENIWAQQNHHRANCQRFRDKDPWSYKEAGGNSAWALSLPSVLLRLREDKHPEVGRIDASRFLRHLPQILVGIR